MPPTNLKPLTLHAHTTGPNPFKTFDPDDHSVKGAKFLSINPNGRVPALQVPKTSITSWESMACINYLLRVYDKEHKLGANTDRDLKRAV
ncbi:hypothetical protein BDV19DRAFT_386692 [Aspergillus venezuelensis]